jgi:hypothetical protein
MMFPSGNPARDSVLAEKESLGGQAALGAEDARVQKMLERESLTDTQWLP